MHISLLQKKLKPFLVVSYNKDCHNIEKIKHSFIIYIMNFEKG
jgi:hypothetical protein